MNIQDLVNKQREFFKTKQTLSFDFHKNMLLKLKNAILNNEKEIAKALKEDLGKSYTESYMCEIGMTLSEISYMIKNLKKFMRPKRVRQTLSQFPAKDKIVSVPYGVSLIMSPWNYPFMLAMEPLVDSISAGNTAVVKPGSYAKETSLIINKIIKETFDENYVACVMGGRDVNSELLNQKFDYIFFTGSKNVGKVVLEKAAQNFTPVTLELGGKSPCIVDNTAKIKLAAKRIVFGKFLNCGQTCVAPDYILVHNSVKEKLIDEIKNQIREQFGEKPLEYQNYGKIINQKHFDRIIGYLNGQNVVYGGKWDDNNRIEPTLVLEPDLNSDIMKEEIFGPILPIISFNNIEDVYNIIDLNPTPLALYLFSTNRKTIKQIVSSVQFGGGCVNDCIMHLATSRMGFGGVGESGMGEYHGKAGFDTFSHKKSMVYKSNVLDINVRYQPYSKGKQKLMKKIMK